MVGGKGLVTYENGFVGLPALGLCCAEDDAEGIGEEDCCVCCYNIC